jgi:oligopeptide/dipeptide ABC transporter ATP-binding protein
MNNAEDKTILTAQHLTLDINIDNKRYPLIEDVSFKVKEGEVLGIVGESGSGKTITCLSLVKLLTTPPFIYRNGSILFENKDLWSLSRIELQKIRGKRISFIFQEAVSALNPVIKIGKQVSEVLYIHNSLNKKDARKKTIELLQMVGIPSPETRFDNYPHQLSGGLQQRVLIAMALASKPSLLIADEPTTALDVTVQIQIMEELKRLQIENRMAIIFINHDLGLVAELCDQVVIMYAGEIIEEATVRDLFQNPIHPYTQMLLKSIPKINQTRGYLTEIPGQVPSPKEYPQGCKFSLRCPYVQEKCVQIKPEWQKFTNGHPYRCWYPPPSVK